MILPSKGEQIGDRYTLEDEIGRGGMQVVYRAYDETLARAVALKVPQDVRSARKFRESAVFAARVNHPNVAKTLDYLETENGMFYLIEELLLGENLRNVSQNFVRLDPHTVAHVLHHLSRGLAASHRVGVVHRDLKPSNIMIVGDLKFSEVKITDFGIAKMAEHEFEEAVTGGEETTQSSKTVMNALAYLAPEVIDSPRTASKSADIWAISAIAWELLTGTPPFGSGLKAIRAIGQGKKPTLPSPVGGHPQFGKLAQELHSLIMTCMDMNPDKRPSAAALAGICDSICYLPPIRELGLVNNYPNPKFGFIRSDAGQTVFFHTKSLVHDGPAPQPGTRVWFTKFEGSPRSRAFPVVPLKSES